MKTHRAQEDAFLSEHRVARRVGRRLFSFRRLLSDKGRRARLGLFLGLFCNLVYLFFWFFGSLFSGFFFFGVTSFYFLFISLLRIYLSHAFEKADLNARWRAFRVTGLLLWLLNLFSLGFSLPAVFESRRAALPDFLFYSAFGYSLARFFVSLSQFFLHRRENHPLVLAARILSLCAVFLSFFSFSLAFISRRPILFWGRFCPDFLLFALFVGTELLLPFFMLAKAGFHT